MAWEQAPISLPIEEAGIYCANRERAEQIGRAYRHGEEMPIVMQALSNRDCTIIRFPLPAMIVAYGETYGGAAGFLQLVEVAPRTGGTARFYFFIPVNKI